jgi:flagellar basal body-associated protein FliL
MINFNNKKNKQIFSAIIIILVLAMVVPMVASALLY